MTTIPYIHFTEEQKQRAATVDLPEFLRRQGEKLLPSGREYRLDSDHSITVRANSWYDHAAGRGGGPISFVQNFYDLSYPEAVSRLLDGEQGLVCSPAPKQKEQPRKDFALPPANDNMRRVYAYLLKQRLLDRDVVTAFAKAGLLYESCEKYNDREIHNAVFVGKDEHGVARHAHKRSVNDIGKSFRINIEGSDPRHSFHHAESSDRLYVFEAPIDMLSFLTLYPKNWQQHSFVSLCGTSEHAMLSMLERNPKIQSVILCLDHDAAGIEASGRLTEILRERGYDNVGVLQSEYKDWNEDIKARRGLEAQPPEEHPQLIAAPEICRRIALQSENTCPEFLERDIPQLIRDYRDNLSGGRLSRAMDCMEQASALALAVYGQGLRQLGEESSAEALSETLCSRILPHQNHVSLKNRHTELVAQLKNVLAKASASGIRGEAEKRSLAESWLELAVSFAKVPVKYEADILKQQKQEQTTLQLKMG